MSTWEQQLASIRKLRENRNEANEKVYSGRTELLKVNRQLEQVLRKQDDTSSRNERELTQRKLELERSISNHKDKVGIHVKGLHEAIEGIYVDPHPRRSTANVNDSVPFLLMPVRMETRFMHLDTSSPELWLRIYPDDIAIHTQEKWLTTLEVSNGKAYWENIFDAEKSDEENRENLKRASWTNLATRFGSQRSSWIAKQTRPVNWNDITTLTSHSQLIFPVNDITTENWSTAPRTNVLPDKFVISLFQHGTMVKEVVGNLIPDELIVGPDPMDTEAAFQTVDNKLVFGEDYAWTYDFDKAVEKGMGVKIPLTAGQARTGFDKIVVLGLSLSMDRMESKQELESLIDNHHYSPNGFSIVPQGTPTNNTEQEGSGYQSNDPFNAESYYVETGDPLFREYEDKDGRFLAEALGISPEIFHYILNADGTDRKAATDMNIALYPSTLGYYFDTMLKPAVNEGTQKTIRDFFTKHVSGRGPLSAIRVGNQPYGVMLTSDFSKWTWSRNEGYDPKFLNGLLKIINHYDDIWKSLISKVAYAGKPATDPAETLMDILGLQAGSVSFFQRVGFDKDTLINRAEFRSGGRYNPDFNDWNLNSNKGWDFLKTNGAELEEVNGEPQFPQLLQLIYKHFHTTLDSTHLIDGKPVSEDRLVTNYDEVANKNYLHWLYETVSIAQLEKQDFGDGKKETALLYQQLRRALLLQIHKSAVSWFDNNGLTMSQASGAINFYNIRPEPTPTKWEVIKAKVAFADAAHPQANLDVGEYLQTYGINETEASFLKKIKQALHDLSGLETAKLERCLTEHIDVCSYRLDAWQTAFFKLRLEQQRNQPEANNGIHLGCYGYVEDLRPEERTRIATNVSPAISRLVANKPLFEFINNGGFVHTPSLNHALAAAVLRSGYLNHANAENNEILSINLSSERIRRALFVLDGIRNGQRIEALLGYQFERGLHDRASADSTLLALNAYIYDFRDKYPIDQHYILQQGNTESETIPANNVVNGLLLAEDDFPFKVNILGTLEQAAIIAEKDRLNDTLDAIKDLFMSESVYQLVQGNFDRAGAVMTALKDTTIPPELEMIRTPRGSHLGFTNRVSIQFENSGSNPWHPIPMTRRSLIEPGINKWVARMLGEPTTLTCNVSHEVNGSFLEPVPVTLDVLKLQPLDLVYISIGELETRIAFHYRNVHTISDETSIKIEFGPLSGSLSILNNLQSLMTDSRPLDAGDFLPSSVAYEAGSSYDHLELRNRINSSLTQFNEKLNEIRAINIDINGNPTNLGAAFDSLEADGEELNEVEFEFIGVNELLELLTAISEWGLPDCFPVRSQVLNNAEKISLLSQAQNVIRRMGVASEKAQEIIASASMPEVGKIVNTLIEAGKLIFGSSFNFLPKFSFSNAGDILLSSNDSSLLKYATDTLEMDLPADEWMQMLSHVRPRIQRWESIRVLSELRSQNVLEIKPIQVPFREDDSWIAIEFPSERSNGDEFTIDTDTLSVVMHVDGSLDTAVSQSGILIDDWTETIPVKEEITGIAFNYDQPGSMPPQALLLAVPPSISGHWNWDDLIGIVKDTFLRAKQRAVEPAMLDKLDKPEVNVLLPALLASFSQYDMDFALDYRVTDIFFNSAAPILSVDVNN